MQPIIAASVENHLFGASHLGAVGAIAILCVAVAIAGRRIKGTKAERKFDLVFAAVVFLSVAPYQTYMCFAYKWYENNSLPLHLCDVAGWVGVIALATRNRYAFGLLFFWGFTLTPQAIFTPELTYDFPHFRYFLYYCDHGFIVAGAVYLSAGLRQIPSWRLYRLALATTFLYSLAILGFNTLINANFDTPKLVNYMYVSAKPETPSVLDLFGPWPVYLIVEGALIALIWAGITFAVNRFARKKELGETTPIARTKKSVS